MSKLRILVYPHSMDMGGSQLNAIELGKAVSDLGHEVMVIGEEGPLVTVVEQLGLEWLPLDRGRRWPSLMTARSLRNLARERGLDILHGYEWPPGIESAVAAFPGSRTGAVCTVMSMAVAPFLPTYMPLVVGTRALQQHTAALRLGPVHLIEPPVDVLQNAPGHPVQEFRAQFGLADDEPQSPPGPILTVAVVCRLVPELKLEGVLTATKVIAVLARKFPVRLVIVGDGDARCTIEHAVIEANAYAGWRAVVLTGELLDPRPAYAAADVVLGMGGSALRALAFGKPLIVQGEHGFWELLTPDSCPLFLQQGWYGVGSGKDGEARLTDALERLLYSPELRAKLGEYGRNLVVNRFSLQQAARAQEEIYRQTLAPTHRPGTMAQAADLARAAKGVFMHKIKRRYHRIRGTYAREDFNTVTLAGAALNTETTGNNS